MKKKTIKKSRLFSTKKNEFTKFISLRIASIILGCLLLFVTGSYYLQKKLTPYPCANSISCGYDTSGKITENTAGVWMGKRVSAPDARYFAMAQSTVQTNVLGATTPSGEKVIYVDLTQQRVYAFQGTTLVYNFLISSGLWNKTPTGTFSIAVKLQATHMQGGNIAAGDYYDLYNVPWTMYFGNTQIPASLGYSFHGKYWNTTYGSPSSHGCINMQIPDAKQLYDWADPPTQGYTTVATSTNPGTKVVIYGNYVAASH